MDNGIKTSKPEVELTTCDGNVFSILGRCQKTLRRSKYSKEDIDQFISDASSGDYDHALQTVFKWFDVK